MKWYAHKSRICRDSIFVGCTKNLNQCNSDANRDADADAGVTVIALHILRIVELKIKNLDGSKVQYWNGPLFCYG